LALLPLWIAGPEIAAGRLCVVEIGVAAAEEYIYIAHPEGRRPPAKLKALADALRAAFGNPPYWESFRGLSGDESRAGTL
jgi:DNA-binding transcriptional LysR family regulator